MDRGKLISSCITCNAVVHDNYGYPVFYTFLKANGTLLADTLERCLLLQDIASLPGKSHALCRKCYALFEEFAELELRCRELREILWSSHKIATSKRNQELGDIIRGIAVQTDDHGTENCISSASVQSLKTKAKNLPNTGKSSKGEEQLLVNVDPQCDSDEEMSWDGWKAPPKVCKICGKWFKAKAQLRHHLMQHEKLGNKLTVEEQEIKFRLKCKFCERQFKTLRDLRVHLVRHKREQLIYKCRICERTVVTKSGAMYHCRTHNAEVTSNFDLEKAFDISVQPKPENEKSEDEEENDGMSQEGENDNGATSSEDEVPLSKRRKALMKEKNKKRKPPPVQIEESDDDFWSAKPMQLKEPKYKCETCGKMWKTRGERNAHERTHSEARPFICEICGQSYKHKPALDVHVSMHKGIFQHQCPYCKKPFTQKGALQRHLPIHTGELPFQCELCGKRFVHRTSFSIHTLAHTGVRTIKCEVCNLGVLSKSHLRRHMRIHSGEKPYECTYCGKAFAERYNLVAHQRIHDPNLVGMAKSQKKKQSHMCRFCTALFTTKLKMEEHMLEEHKVDPDGYPARPTGYKSSSQLQQGQKLVTNESESSSKTDSAHSEDLKPRKMQMLRGMEIIRSSIDGSLVRIATGEAPSNGWNYLSSPPS